MHEHAEILRDVAAAHGVPETHLSGGQVKTTIVCVARRELFRRLRALGWSYPRIGRACGVDHSTVVKSLRVLVR